MTALFVVLGRDLGKYDAVGALEPGSMSVACFMRSTAFARSSLLIVAVFPSAASIWLTLVDYAAQVAEVLRIDPGSRVALVVRSASRARSAPPGNRVWASARRPGPSWARTVARPVRVTAISSR